MYNDTIHSALNMTPEDAKDKNFKNMDDVIKKVEIKQ